MGLSHLLSGERVAVFGVHSFDFKKIEEYKKTGKAVPIIGGIMLVLSHINSSSSKRRVKPQGLKSYLTQT